MSLEQSTPREEPSRSQPEKPSGPKADDESTLSLETGPLAPTDLDPSTPSTGVDLKEGDVSGDNRLIRFLGRGGFAEVWEAEDRKSGRRIALKVLTGLRHSSHTSVQRFQREARMAASISHENCVYVFGATQFGPYPAIAMELMSGGTLQDQLDRTGPFPVMGSVDIVLSLVRGLEAAQEKGITHRDIKPSNCFIDERGAKIGDFGISKTLEPAIELTLTGAFVGTPAYASPEQLRGKKVDHRSDIYSLGATLYMLLTARLPYSSLHAGDFLARVLSEPPEPMGESRPEVPADLERVVLRMLAREPEKRISTYRQLREELLPFSSQGPVSASFMSRIGANVVDHGLLGLRGLIWPWGAFSFALSSFLLDGASFLYFVLFERFCGWTPGKRLMGIEVRSRRGPGASSRQVWVRNLVFWSVYAFGPNAVIYGILGQIETGTAILGKILVLVVINVTVRPRNGLGGIHELASRTRVYARKRTRTAAPGVLHRLGPRVAREESQPWTMIPAVRYDRDGTCGDSLDQGEAGENPDRLGAPSSGETLAPLDAARVFGPYHARAALGRGAGFTWFRAEDDRLRRNVWVYTYDSPDGAPPLSQFANRGQQRLRWLQGVRTPEEAWDAFEQPAGQSLVDLVRERGNLTWSALREPLAALTDVLEEEAARSEDPATWGIAQIWIQRPDLVKILDFPIPSAQEDPALGSALAPVGWRSLLRTVTSYALTGTPDPGPVSGRALRAPAHARRLLAKLDSDDAGTLAEFARELRGIVGRSMKVHPGRKAMMTAPELVLPLLISAFFLLMSQTQGGSSGAFWANPLSSFLVSLAESHGDAHDPRTVAEAQKILAYHSTPFRRLEVTNQVGPVVAESMDEFLGRNPHVSFEDMREAMETLSGKFVQIRLLSRPSYLFVLVSLLMLLPLAALSLLVSLIVRGSPWHRLFGLEVQTVAGGRPGFLRRGLRTLICWSPCVLVLPVSDALLVDPRYGTIVVLLPLAGAGLYLLLRAYAVARPERGIEDLVARTRVVVR